MVLVVQVLQITVHCTGNMKEWRHSRTMDTTGGVNRENLPQVEAALPHCNLNGQTYWSDDVSRSLHGNHRLLPVILVANCCAG
jgi:hypothetical protein